VAQDASRQRTELRIASFRFFKGSSSVVDAPCASLVRNFFDAGIIHHMGERQRFLRGKIALPRARIRWFERS